ncbi:MAG TPA: DUF3418 domain-containing protein, partial [Ilumatobacteraceae bacterium]|nr:DUF3418 domain-containing protein [Ilumatobacteraceae bacterium]
RFDPGSPLDGATVHVPLAALNQVTPTGFDWGVPGFRDKLVDALLRNLPKEHRRELVPMNEVVAKVQGRLGGPSGWEDGTSLAAALATTVHECTGVRVPSSAFDHTRVPGHLTISFSVDDADGTPLAIGKDLVALQRELAARQRLAVAQAAPIDERKGITTWEVGDVATEVSTVRAGVSVKGYPALLDDGDSVSLRVFTSAALQEKVMRGGVRRLLLLTVPVGVRALQRDLDNKGKLAVAGVTTLDALQADCLAAAADQVLAEFGEVPFTEAGFAALVAMGRDELPDRAATAVGIAAEACAVAGSVRARLDRLVAPAVAAGADDARAQLDRLVRPGFVAAAGTGRLRDVVRYLKALDHRLSKLPEDPARDAARLRDVAALERRYTQFLRRLHRDEITAQIVDFGWQLEELRVATFAQQLGTAKSVSVQRLAKELAALGG